MKEKKRVLFICVENACRSQMAEGFARQLGGDVLEAYSAGSHPSGKINPDAVKVMAETGVDISVQESKGFKDLPVHDFDYVVTMGCGDVCPFMPSKRYLDWDLENPRGKSVYFFRQTRDKIEDKVKGLIRSIIAADAKEKNATGA
jgi:arsenate reductase (thioredoxin)